MLRIRSPYEHMVLRLGLKIWFWDLGFRDRNQGSAGFSDEGLGFRVEAFGVRGKRSSRNDNVGAMVLSFPPTFDILHPVMLNMLSGATSDKV